jgi:hypothetical protein
MSSICTFLEYRHLQHQKASSSENQHQYGHWKSLNPIGVVLERHPKPVSMSPSSEEVVPLMVEGETLSPWPGGQAYEGPIFIINAASWATQEETKCIKAQFIWRNGKIRGSKLSTNHGTSYETSQLHAKYLNLLQQVPPGSQN